MALTGDVPRPLRDRASSDSTKASIPAQNGKEVVL
jgi:hypothetical protein